MSEIKPGDIVDLTARGVRVERLYPTSRWSAQAEKMVPLGKVLAFTHRDEHMDGYLHTVDIGSVGVTVAPHGHPDAALERALVVLSDKVADLRATAERCDLVCAGSRAIESRTEADAVRDGMVAVLADSLSQDQAEPVVLDRVYRLIAEAVVRRGGR